MAIEFNCPYCTATIRVPDAYAGKQGRCPKCDTKLLIPSVPLPHQPGIAPQLASPPPVQELANAFSPPPPFSSASPATLGQMPNGLGSNVAASDDPFAVRPVTTTTGRSRRRNARRRPSRALVIGVPVICFLVLFGIIALSVMNSLPQLHGQFTGRRMDGLLLPRTVIPWSELNLDADAKKVLQQEFTTHPESLASQVIACRLSGSNEGIDVVLSAQPESQWIVVDISLEKPLSIWRRKEGPALNRRRMEEMRAAVNVYAKDKLLKANGQQVAIDAVTVRDKVALNACGGPMSYAIQAIADSTIFPCAAEDGLGQLFFCLPKTVTSFKILGRPLADGSIGFSGEYTVTISSDTMTSETIEATETSPSIDKMEPDSPMAEGEQEMSEEDFEMSESGKKMMDPESMNKN